MLKKQSYLEQYLDSIDVSVYASEVGFKYPVKISTKVEYIIRNISKEEKYDGSYVSLLMDILLVGARETYNNFVLSPENRSLVVSYQTNVKCDNSFMMAYLSPMLDEKNDIFFIIDTH